MEGDLTKTIIVPASQMQVRQVSDTQPLPLIWKLRDLQLLDREIDLADLIPGKPSQLLEPSLLEELLTKFAFTLILVDSMKGL